MEKSSHWGYITCAKLVKCNHSTRVKSYSINSKVIRSMFSHCRENVNGYFREEQREEECWSACVVFKNGGEGAREESLQMVVSKSSCWYICDTAVGGYVNVSAVSLCVALRLYPSPASPPRKFSSPSPLFRNKTLFLSCHTHTHTI